MSWLKRNTVGADRVNELKELYKSLGFEVKIEPVTVAPDETACQGCYAGPGEYFVIYTRKIPPSPLDKGGINNQSGG
jgi:hypothetical protein